MKQDINIDMTKAAEVAKRLSIAFESRYGIFEDISDLLEFQIPEDVQQRSLEHARFLFYLISQDYGTKSSRLYEKAKDLYKKQPDLFDPYYITNKYMGPDDASLANDTGGELGTRFPRETAKRWFMNSEKLINEFHGDPREIFRVSSDARKVMKEIRAFRGFGPKIGGCFCEHS